MALLKFLFITICVLWLIRMLARIFLPMLFQSMVHKAQNQANQRYQDQTRPEGRIRVDYIPPKEKNQKNNKAGDFIEYEEIN
jgi:hypothetical protein